jgi:hypothetical protein
MAGAATAVSGTPVEGDQAASDGAPGATAGFRQRGSSQPTAASTADPAAARTDWDDRIARLRERIDAGEVERTQADRLYAELARVLWREQAKVFEALWSRSPDALDRRARLNALYSARLRLLEIVTPGLRSRLFGASPDGLQAIRREFGHFQLNLFFQTLAIPRGLRSAGEALVAAPLDQIRPILHILFAVLVFRGWRRWAKKGLPNVRRKLVSVRPATAVQLRLARLVWYLDRFRGPLEWLALLGFLSTVYDPGDLDELTTLVWVILLWTLLTRFGLLLVDAIATRGAHGLRRGVAELRLRSLRLVAGWVLLTGLGLDLTSRYVGEAAIHAWASRAFALLLVPVALVLLHWWKADILSRVEHDASFSTMAKRIGTQSRGVRGYVNAALGAVYILVAKVLQQLIRLASHFDAGRRLMATLLRREAERDAEKERTEGKPISQELMLDLLTPDETVIDGPFKGGIERAKEIVSNGNGAMIAVLADRGGGVSTYLDLLKEAIGESMRIVDCPPGGIERFEETLAAEFGLADTEELTTKLRPAMEEAGVRIVAVRNYHRIVRPQMGGLAGIERATEIADGVGDDFFWIVALTRASWPYIARLLGDRAVVRDVIELPPWSEEQLGELFDARCRKAGIEPDYRRLVFPRQFDDGERETLEERNRFGLHRVIWEISDGNPEVAIRLFADCLRELPSGEIVVRSPQPASADQIAAANLSTLLILKVLLETELASTDDLVAATREPRETVAHSLAYCQQQGWVEEVYEHYQVTWSAYRRVKRVLERRGLIPR